MRALLAEVYMPEGVEIWLQSQHQLHGERAMDLLASGRGDEVLAAAQRLTGGGW